MNKEVNFEIAKLLREKGFNEPCTQLYFDGELKDITIQKVSYDDTLSSRYYIAPTIAEVVMWLYVKHGVWVYTRPVLDEDGEWIFKGYVKHLKYFKAKEYQTKLLREPTEAYEAAITYTLENLI